jgi:hypothetical protein
MIIFKDFLTGDEVLSDSYDLKEVDGVVYEADCAMIELGAVNVGSYINCSGRRLLAHPVISFLTSLLCGR